MDWLGPSVAETVTTKLNAIRSLQLVERAQLYQVLAEQKLSLSDLVDPTQAVGSVPSRVEKRNGAFFRLVKCTTNRPPWQAATGGMRHGQRYQEAGRHA